MKNRTEEYVSCILGGTDTNPDINDYPGWHSGLSDGAYRRFHLEFEYAIWDTCQGQWQGSGDKGVLEIKGNKPPRFVSY